MVIWRVRSQMTDRILEMRRPPNDLNAPAVNFFFQKIQIQGWKQEFRQRREQTSNYFAARAHQVLRGGKKKTVTHTKCGLLSSSGFSWLQGQIEFVIWPRSRLTETQQDHGFVSQTLVFRTESNKPHYNSAHYWEHLETADEETILAFSCFQLC